MLKYLFWLPAMSLGYSKGLRGFVRGCTGCASGLAVLGCAGAGGDLSGAQLLPVEPGPGVETAAPPAPTLSPEITRVTGLGLKDSDSAEGRGQTDRFTSTCELLEITYRSGAQGEYSDASFGALPGDIVDAFGSYAPEAVADPRETTPLLPMPQEVVVLHGDRSELTGARCVSNPGFVRDVNSGEPYFVVVVAHSASADLDPKQRAAVEAIGPVPHSAMVTAVSCMASGLEEALGAEPQSLVALRFAEQSKATAWASRFEGAKVVQVANNCE